MISVDMFVLPQLTTLLSEKEDHISHLQERAQTLEQRLQDGNLSGDDRVTALEKEVIALYVCLGHKRCHHIYVSLINLTL